MSAPGAETCEGRVQLHNLPDAITAIENDNSTIKNSTSDYSKTSSRRSLRQRRDTLTQWVNDKREKVMTVKQLKRYLLATISRSLFTAHGIVMIWLLVEVMCNPEYWILLIGLFGVYVEMFITLNVTEKGEWKWFSPTVFIYLCVTIPCIFLSELELQQNSNVWCNYTSYREWLDAMEQLMILVLIMGRWIMPKGAMTREQLAQLLLLYIGLGADILDILTFLKDDQIRKNNVTVVGLCLFSWAILQFTLVLTQSSESVDKRISKDSVSVPAARKQCSCMLSAREVWSLVIAVVMQDGPFLGFRLYLLIKHGVRSKTLIFFICKNILTVTIEIYRIIVVWRQAHRNRM
ncbi:transmembrane protein 26-like [Pelobates fuscus]|uniref:transmembrane protein 26-like n=1 Tax=Pelobates fuscus TaxID=191477 RepID=UPI002FE43D44